MSSRSSSSGVELRRLGGELVVELGQVLLAHLLDRRPRSSPSCRPARSGWWSSGKVTSTVRSSPAPAPASAGVELRQQALGAELDHEVAATSEPSNGSPSIVAREVDHDDVAGRRPGARPASRLPKPSRRRSTSVVDRLLGDLDLGPADLEPLVLAELGRRAHRDLDRERELLALAGQLADVELRVADRVDPELEQRPLVPLGQRVAQRLLDHRLAPDPLDHQLRRHLALAKAGHLQLAGEADARRGRPALRSPRRSTATSILTRESGSSVTVVLIGAPELSARYRFGRGPRDDGDRHLERRALHALRRADRRASACSPLLRPGRRDRHRDHRRRLRRGRRRTRCSAARSRASTALSYCLVGAVGHDFVDGERDGPRGFPRFTDPRLRGPDELRGLPAPRHRGEPRADRGRLASTCSCSTTPIGSATARRRSGTRWRPARRRPHERDRGRARARRTASPST